MIGPSGGSLTTPDGAVTLTIPAGALANPTTVSITGGLKGSAFGAGTTTRNLLAVVQLEPEGVVFDPPATLQFAWPDANNDGRVDGTTLREKNLKVYRNGVVVPGTTACGAQACSAAACCSMPANTWTLQVTQFSEWAVGTVPCGATTTAKLTLTKLSLPAGDDKLNLKGELTLVGPVAAQLDPVVNGLVVRLVDGDTVVLDAEIPGGAYDTATRTGWKRNAPSTKWKWLGPKTGGPGGLVKVDLTDKSAKAPGLVQFKAKGLKGSYVASTAVDVAVVLPESAQCFEARFAATPPTSPSCTLIAGVTLKCK